MKIGILGAGNIGGGLGRRWVAAGHQVRFGVRDPERAAALVVECGGGASAGSIAEAAAFGEVVVLAVPWAAALDAVAAAGDLSGKVLVDATNALRWDDGPMAALEGTSAAETIAAHTAASVVKAFNTLGAEHLATGQVGGVPADVFLCSDDPAAKLTVAGLAEQLGFTAVDLGPLRYARSAEQIAIAWIYLAMKGGLGRNVAFKVLRG
jgi:8-hydroxy-5-deazaflavin:NADPH oxidoreductase